jgi:hypothetical protein
MTPKTLGLAIGGALIAGLLNKIAGLYYAWTWFDYVLPFLPLLLLAACAFMKHQSEQGG